MAQTLIRGKKVDHKKSNVGKKAKAEKGAGNHSGTTKANKLTFNYLNKLKPKFMDSFVRDTYYDSVDSTVINKG